MATNRKYVVVAFLNGRLDDVQCCSAYRTFAAARAAARKANTQDGPGGAVSYQVYQAVTLTEARRLVRASEAREEEES